MRQLVAGDLQMTSPQPGYPCAEYSTIDDCLHLTIVWGDEDKEFKRHLHLIYLRSNGADENQESVLV